MARLYLFAEGQTEQTFADTILSPHLANLGTYTQRSVRISHGKKKKHIVHRGGGRKYTPMKNDIARFLAQEKAADVFFTTMIDLYAIPGDFPGLAEAEKLRHLPYERVESLERSFADDIGDSRFIPYIQLHEYEAYLFSNPQCFNFFYPRHKNQISALIKLASDKTSPELINDGIHTAPSKRIIEQFPDYGDAKPVIGPQVAELIGLATIRENCPHFVSWLSRLERL